MVWSELLHVTAETLQSIEMSPTAILVFYLITESHSLAAHPHRHLR